MATKKGRMGRLKWKVDFLIWNENMVEEMNFRMKNLSGDEVVGDGIEIIR